ncbi:MAG: hypothetical protein J6D15_00325 [Clostridia bacterium]|nr:hypothetical protein [Clostridia bacterium]
MKKGLIFFICFLISFSTNPICVAFATETESAPVANWAEEKNETIDEIKVPVVKGKADVKGLEIDVDTDYDDENALEAFVIRARSTSAGYKVLSLNISDALRQASVYRKKMPSICIYTDFAVVTLDKDIIRELRDMSQKQDVFITFEKNEKLNREIKNKLSNGKFEINCYFKNQHETRLDVSKKFFLEIPYVSTEMRDSVQLYSVNGTAVLLKKSERGEERIGCSVSNGESILFSEGAVVMITGRTLDLQGTISMVFYASLEGVRASTARMLFWDSPQDEYTLETAQRVVEYSGSDANGYRFEYDNISSVDMNKKIHARLMARDEKGNIIYGSAPYVGYSVVSYAENMMKNEQLRPLLVKMLNYGAAAQEYFGSDRKPANSTLSETDKVMDFTKVYVSQAKTIKEETKNGKCSASIIGKTLILEGDISINYYVSDEKNVDEMGVLFWTEDSFKKTDSHIAGTQSLIIKDYAINNGYKVYNFDNIVSSKMFDNIYARVYTRVGNKYRYSDIDKYSVRDYAANQLSKSNDTLLKNLLRRLLIYGDEAKRYFKVSGR